MRENLSTRLICSWILKKDINKNNLGYISAIRPEATQGRMCTKFAIEVADVITCDNFLAIG